MKKLLLLTFALCLLPFASATTIPLEYSDVVITSNSTHRIATIVMPIDDIDAKSGNFTQRHETQYYSWLNDIGQCEEGAEQLNASTCTRNKTYDLAFGLYKSQGYYLEEIAANIKQIFSIIPNVVIG